jgi:hypothetical protein
MTLFQIFGLKALYILAQWQRPERTTPWENIKRTKFDGLN